MSERAAREERLADTQRESITMISQASVEAPMLLTTATCPGGIARQYRVQFHDSRAESWQVHATFTSREAAQACLARLLAGGCRARLVDYSRCPTAL